MVWGLGMWFNNTQGMHADHDCAMHDTWLESRVLVKESRRHPQGYEQSTSSETFFILRRIVDSTLF